MLLLSTASIFVQVGRHNGKKGQHANRKEGINAYKLECVETKHSRTWTSSTLTSITHHLQLGLTSLNSLCLHVCKPPLSQSRDSNLNANTPIVVGCCTDDFTSILKQIQGSLKDSHPTSFGHPPNLMTSDLYVRLFVEYGRWNVVLSDQGQWMHNRASLCVRLKINGTRDVTVVARWKSLDCASWP